MNFPDYIGWEDSQYLIQILKSDGEAPRQQTSELCEFSISEIYDYKLNLKLKLML